MTKLTRREALAGVGGGLRIVKPKAAFGTQANSAVLFGTIGTGGRGVYVTDLMSRDPSARLAAVCDIFPERIDRVKTRVPAAVNAGKHIYCEKPAAAERADKSKTIAFGFQRRFSPEYLAAEKIIRDPETFGELTIMMSFWIWGGNAASGTSSNSSQATSSWNRTATASAYSTGSPDPTRSRRSAMKAARRASPATTATTPTSSTPTPTD